MMQRFLFSMPLIAGLGLLFQEHVLHAETAKGVSIRTEQSVNKNIRAWQEKNQDLSAPGQTWMEISLAQAIEKAIQANLELRQSALAVKNAQESRTATEASIFDPIVSVSGGFSRSETEAREVQEMGYKKATLRCPQKDDNIVLDEHGSLIRVIKPEEPGYDERNALPSDSLWICTQPADADFSASQYTVFPPTSPVHYLHLNKERPEGYYPTTEVASKADPKGPIETGTLSVALSKSLPWGLDLSLSEQTTHQDALWVLNKNAPQPIVGSYDRPWTSSSSLALSLPVPGGKNFGRHAERDVAVELAALDQQRSRAEFQTQANTLLQSVQMAYWDLVGGSRTLDVTTENRRTVEQLLVRTRKLFALERTTAYAMAQMEAEWERVHNQEIVAWSSYVLVSNTLKRLLNLSDKHALLLIPVDYSSELSRFSGIDTAEALQVGHLNNAQIQSQEINKARADLSHKQSENQTHPDLSLNVSLSGSQSRGLFGYGSPQESLSNLFDPDMISVSAGVSYRYPWKNQWAEAKMAQADSQQAVSHLQEQLVSNQVERSIKNARVSMDSALLRIAITGRRLQLARASYASAERLRVAERIAEHELLTKSGDLLTAEKEFILAQVDAKKAEADLLASMGTLGQNEQLSKEILHESAR